jgi:hydroxymethylbilane synthase
LLDGRVDLAVHSLKDLPTEAHPGLALLAVPPREDVADALIAPRHGTLVDLPPGARIGTGSLRRQAQLRKRRPDISVTNLRGNVETRIRQAVDGLLDGVVLAAAGLRRLGLDGQVTEWLRPPDFLPAVSQGALGLEGRDGDRETRAWVEALDDRTTHAAVRAERQVLRVLRGGCHVPVGAWGQATHVDRIVLHAGVFGLEGVVEVRAVAEGSLAAPEALGDRVARELLDGGASELLGDSRDETQ